MKEYIFDKCFFHEKECAKIKEIMEGYSYMDFHISWSNYAGNCTLIIKTDYKATEEHIKTFFLYCLITRLLD